MLLDQIKALDKELHLLHINTDISNRDHLIVEEFWACVSNKKYGDSTLFPLPKFRNAAVERVFSSVNLMKT